MIVCVVLVGLSFMIFPRSAWALLPPDVLFSVGSTVVQFFSIAALLVASIFSSIVITARNWLLLSRKNLLLILSGIAVLTLVAIVLVYITELHKQEAVYQHEVTRLQSQNNNLQQILLTQAPESEYQSLLDRLADNGPLYFAENASSSLTSRHFYGDFILLYGEVGGQPFAVEMDFNRQEESRGLFNHYTFLDGSIGGEFFSEYDLVYATSSELQVNAFMDRIVRSYASDLSPRDVYEGTLFVLERPLSFRTEGLYGDFITRNRASYLQYQTVGQATVSYDNQESKVYAFVEGVVSTDYSKHLFFPGRDKLNSKTYQFILWDATGNFYAIDKTEVFSDTPEYPSHTWVLYKSVDGKVEKRFAADVTSSTDAVGTVTWSISIPLYESNLTLKPTQPFKQAADDRFRSIVTGTIVDQKGERKIGGVLHLVE